MIFLSFLPSFSLVFLALTLRSRSLFPVCFSIDESGIPSYWLHVFLSQLPFLKWSSPSILKYFWGKKQCLYHFTAWASPTSHYSSHPASYQGYTHLLPQKPYHLPGFILLSTHWECCCCCCWIQVYVPPVIFLSCSSPNFSLNTRWQIFFGHVSRSLFPPHHPWCLGFFWCYFSTFFNTLWPIASYSNNSLLTIHLSIFFLLPFL